MAFGYSHIEGAGRHLVHQYGERATTGHGWGNTHDAVVLARQFQQRLAKHILKLRWLRFGGFTLQPLACLGIKLAWSMPDRRALLGRLIAFALLGVKMEELRSLHILDLSEDTHQFRYIVAVVRTKIADVHPLKHILLMGQRTLQGIVQSDNAFPPVVVQVATLVQPLAGFEAETVVGLVRVQIEQVFLHTAHRPRSILMSLSLRIMSRSLGWLETLLSPSKASPPLIAPSPMIATAWRFSVFCRRASPPRPFPAPPRWSWKHGRR